MLLYRRGAVDAALKTLGIGTLYDWQKEVIQCALQGQDIFLRAQTAGGKSLIYQLLAVAEAGRGLTLVFSPHRSLQKDQVMPLTARGVKAAWLNSDLSNKERKEVLDNLSKYSLLYLAPEQLSAHDLQKVLKTCNVERVVVDEAHVLPQMAPDFRPAYGEIGNIIHKLFRQYPPQIIACTATATKKEQKTIIESLGMNDPEIYTYPLRRDNLHLSAKRITVSRKCKSKKEKLEELLFHEVEATLQEWNGKGSAIIYCPTVKRVELLKKWLSGRGWNVTAYTSKMTWKDRSKVQEQFMSGVRKIMVATNGFGLGINKENVHMVIHAGPPLTFSGYVQEIGRAGRDGKKSKCVLFYSDTEFHRNKRILMHSESKEAARNDLDGLEELKRFLSSPECLWTQIEKYYGQKSGGVCGHCCRCKAKAARE